MTKDLCTPYSSSSSLSGIGLEGQSWGFMGQEFVRALNVSAANGQGKLKLSINFTRIFVNFDCNCSFDSNCNCDYNCNWTAVITASISFVKVSFNGMQAINNLFSAL